MTWARLDNPNLDRIWLTCVSTVRLLNTSSVAISLFDLPCPISAATSRSRPVRPSGVSLAIGGVLGLRKNSGHSLRPVQGTWRCPSRLLRLELAIGELDASADKIMFKLHPCRLPYRCEGCPLITAAAASKRAPAAGSPPMTAVAAKPIRHSVIPGLFC